ncbi:MAG TPA: RcpC/CpaB family pilus assembly protein [Anaerovoracaceae bacterium]|nr:RcpC/CpaB family pilus assembly protein [Anaerovoracaceae bacterium]
MKLPRLTKEQAAGVPKNGVGKKFLNRKVKAVLCFAIAFVIAFVLWPMAMKEQAETGTVAVSNKAIAKGEAIKESDISMKTVGTYGLSGDYITDRNEIAGKVAKVDIVENDMILKSKIGNYTGDPVIDSIVGEDKRLVSVTVKTNAAGLASHIERGDILNVSCVAEAVDEYGASAGIQVLDYPELKNMEVYDVENAGTLSVEDARTSKEANADPIINTITFIATEDQAAKLIECEYRGNIHVTFVKRGAGVE